MGLRKFCACLRSHNALLITRVTLFVYINTESLSLSLTRSLSFTTTTTTTRPRQRSPPPHATSTHHHHSTRRQTPTVSIFFYFFFFFFFASAAPIAATTTAACVDGSHHHHHHSSVCVYHHTRVSFYFIFSSLHLFTSAGSTTITTIHPRQWPPTPPCPHAHATRQVSIILQCTAWYQLYFLCLCSSRIRTTTHPQHITHPHPRTSTTVTCRPSTKVASFFFFAFFSSL